MRTAVRLAAILVPLLAAAAPAASAGDPTSGLAFLRIKEGVRAAAMGDAFAALADDATAIHWNPAGVAQLLGGQVYAEHAVWFDQKGYDFVGYTHRIVPDTLILGLGITSQQDEWDSVDRSDPANAAVPKLFGGNAAFQMAVATRLGTAADLGLNIKAVRSGFGQHWVTAWGGDAGFLLHLVEDAWTLALTANDFGPSFQNPKTLALPKPSFQTFPFSIRLATSFRAVDEGFKIFTFNLDGEWPMDTSNFSYSKPNGGIGFELWLFKTLALRGGYRIRPTDLPWTGAWTMGAGFHYWIWTFDYAFQPMGELGTVHRGSIALEFRPDAWANMKYAKKKPKTGKPGDYPTPIIVYKSPTPYAPPVTYPTPTPYSPPPPPYNPPPPPYHPPPPGPTIIVVAPPMSYPTPTPYTVVVVQPTIAVGPRPTFEPARAVGPPTGLSLERDQDQTFLKWQNPSQLTTVEGYNVYHGVSPTGPWGRINSGAPVKGTRVPVTLAPGKIVYLMVRTVDASGNESTNSDVISNSLTAPTAMVRPAAPSGATMEMAGVKTTISWQASRDPSVVGFHVYHAPTRGGPYQKLTTTPRTGNSASITTGDKRFYFVVTAVNVDGVESEQSSEATLRVVAVATVVPPTPTATPKVLPAPKSVRVEDEKGRIRLQWSEPPAGAVGANVYVHKEGAPYAKSNPEALTVTKYYVPKLESGKMYYFVVRYLFAEGEGPNSPEASIFVTKVPSTLTPTRTLSPTISMTPTETPIYFQPPKVPALLSISGGDKSVTLRWAAHPDKNVVGFNVYRSSTSGQGYQKVLRGAKGPTSATVTGLQNGVTYYFVVTASNAAKQESAFSNEISAAAGP